MSLRSLIIGLCLLGTASSYAQTSEVQINYIERYRDIAIREMERAGIPASIKLAQGLLESNAGRSDLARRARNHFGMKCGSNWQGDTMYKEDDDYDENGRLIKSCFRSYRNADASYVAHSEFLRDPRKAFRYGFLFRLDPYDYQAWAHGLKRAGYATSPTYPEKLISLIERYQLDQYDKQGLAVIDEPGGIDPGPTRPGTGTGRPGSTAFGTGVLRTNDVNYVLANSGESLDDIARRVEVSVQNLLSFNEQLRPNVPPTAGERVYVQPKRSSYRGRQKYHVVAAGETMMSISQEYAVRLDKLMSRNLLQAGQEPAVGEKVKLRGLCKAKEAPKVRSANSSGGTSQPPSNRPNTTQPNVPTTPTGELDMTEPDDEFLDEEFPARPANPGSGTTQPSQPTTAPVGTNNERPGVIINPGSRPVSPPPTTSAPPPPPSQPTTTQPAPPVVIQPSTPVPTQPSAEVYHTVQAGETLWRISQQYGTTVDSIKQLNGLVDNSISIGARLRVK